MRTTCARLVFEDSVTLRIFGDLMTRPRKITTSRYFGFGRTKK